jgi:hypothetical protein
VRRIDNSLEFISLPFLSHKGTKEDTKTQFLLCAFVSSLCAFV